MSCWMVMIWGLIWLPSFWVTLAAITGLDTPQALQLKILIFMLTRYFQIQLSTHFFWEFWPEFILFWGCPVSLSLTLHVWTCQEPAWSGRRHRGHSCPRRAGGCGGESQGARCQPPTQQTPLGHDSGSLSPRWHPKDGNLLTSMLSLWIHKIHMTHSIRIIFYQGHLAKLLVVGSLLNQVEDLGGQGLIIQMLPHRVSWILKHTCSARG